MSNLTYELKSREKTEKKLDSLAKPSQTNWAYFQHPALQADKLTKHGRDERDHKRWVHSYT